MSDLDRLRQELERARDEIRLKMHLASMEAREEWDELEGKWEKFKSRAQMSESAEGVGHAVSSLGDELKQAYSRFRRALSD